MEPRRGGDTGDLVCERIHPPSVLVMPNDLTRRYEIRTPLTDRPPMRTAHPVSVSGAHARRPTMEASDDVEDKQWGIFATATSPCPRRLWRLLFRRDRNSRTATAG
ncbi:unnamed protein product [Musa banksii]